MRLSCPTCRSPLSEGLECAEGHRFEEVDGVLRLLDAGFATRLQEFNTTLGRYRDQTGRRLLDAALYDELPFSLAGRHFEWKMRRHDLTLVTQLIGSQRRRVLDVGAWNGWLSHRLSQLGHEVTAVDYFDDPFDGLGARRHYQRPSWRAVQLDLADLSSLDWPFDVVILNRCLAFFTDPVAYVGHVQSLSEPGSLVLATGLAFYRDARAKAREVDERQRAYRERFGAELFLRPTKGYLDWADRRALERAGLEIRTDRRQLRANLEARLRPTKPFYCWGRLRTSTDGRP